jgi:hypothetical protein
MELFHGDFIRLRTYSFKLVIGKNRPETTQLKHGTDGDADLFLCILDRTTYLTAFSTLKIRENTNLGL